MIGNNNIFIVNSTHYPSIFHFIFKFFFTIFIMIKYNNFRIFIFF